VKKPLAALFILSGLVFSASFQACQKTYTLGPAAPTPTSTPLPTPVCAFTPLPATYYTVVPTSFSLGPPSTFVIQSQSQWVSVNGPSAPLPAVNFSSQMILELALSQSCYCMCWANPPAISSVCAGWDQIEVEYEPGGCGCPTGIAPTCAGNYSTNIQALAVVNQSSLPVTWIMQ
jgi:hypothetical protein